MITSYLHAGFIWGYWGLLQRSIEQGAQPKPQDKCSRKEVTSISVHASGRLALTASRDGTLKLWNLVRGKCVHTRTLPAVAEQIAFSPSGGAYALLFGPQVPHFL